MVEHNEGDENSERPPIDQRLRNDLRDSIVNVMCPVRTEATNLAITNSSRKRSRVQAKQGEILTESNVMLRLEKEKLNRQKLAPMKNPISRQQPCSSRSIQNKENSNLSSDDDDESETSATDESINDSTTKRAKPMTKNLTVGDWVFVKCGRVHPRKYVANIIAEASNGDYEVSFLRQCDENSGPNTFSFPLERDFASIDMSDVVQVLNPPSIDRRGRYCFTDLL